MFHTNLIRTKGESKSGWDLRFFDWSKFDLIIIDESHNLCNYTEKRCFYTLSAFIRNKKLN